MPLFKKKVEPPYVAAVVVAAGGGSRMAGIDKQLFELGGVPVVARSVAALSACPRVREIVLVCRGEQLADYYDLVKLYGFDKVKTVIKGGEQRQQSVAAGLAACSGEAACYAIHDGARPLVLPQDIDRCIDFAYENGAAAVAVPVTDTIKICDENRAVIQTPNRERLWAVQTPQIFEAGLYRRALESATNAGHFYTDDCQLVENAGHTVVMSPGSHGNIKITRPEDIAIAEAILEFREGLRHD
jgi:2-C-methyl-D-erythritol 4-phosphate cytidylyltransferase